MVPQAEFLEYTRQGFEVHYANILVMLTRLRQACVHPFLAQTKTAVMPLPPEGAETGDDAEGSASAMQGDARLKSTQSQSEDVLRNR